MNTFKLIITSPDGTVFDEEVVNIALRGTNGDLAVMAGHIPFITSVKPGICRITRPDQTEKSARIDGGLLTVAKEKTTLLSGTFVWDEG